MAGTVDAENTHGPLTTIRHMERKMAAAKSTRKIACRNYYIAGKQSKVCPSCGAEKPLTAYPILKRNQSSGRASYCKECKKTKYPYSALSMRARHLRHRYGLDIESVVAMWESQGRACAICKSEISLERTAHVDHCHVTNKVRGLLCFYCNGALGKFKDNVVTLQAAIRYLHEQGQKT